MVCGPAHTVPIRWELGERVPSDRESKLCAVVAHRSGEERKWMVKLVHERNPPFIVLGLRVVSREFPVGTLVDSRDGVIGERQFGCHYPSHHSETRDDYVDRFFIDYG